MTPPIPEPDRTEAPEAATARFRIRWDAPARPARSTDAAAGADPLEESWEPLRRLLLERYPDFAPLRVFCDHLAGQLDATVLADPERRAALLTLVNQLEDIVQALELSSRAPTTPRGHRAGGPR